MNTLHVLNQSPFTHQQLANCLLFLAAHDAILLTGDAVYALQGNTQPCQQLQQLTNTQIFALEEDVKARAIQITIDHITLIEYPAFVTLCTHYQKINSWLL